MNSRLVKLIKEIQFNSPFRRYCFPRFIYNFTAAQLCFLCQCLEDTSGVAGAIAEVGCADGSTTIFLNKYLDAQDIRKNYYAVDTFSGFVSEDIALEIENRGKTPDMIVGFEANKKKWFDATMRQNNITRVRSIETDVNRFDLRALGPFSFVLLDVDLYRPIKKTLPEIYQALTPHGIIVVDDCDSGNIRWDGADQAYSEFMAERGEAPQIVHGKLGIIRKNS